MKLIQFLPAVFAVAVLSACSTTNSVEKNSAVANEENALHMANQTQTVHYFCVSGKHFLNVTYIFDEEKVIAAEILDGNNMLTPNLRIDESYSDGTQFIDPFFVWTLSEKLTRTNASRVLPVMLYAKGAKNDAILAKNCHIGAE